MTRNGTLIEDLSILVQEGIYKNQETLRDDAMRALLRSKPELRVQLALALYKRGSVTLARASEIAGVDRESFKEFLREAGVSYRVEPVGNAIEHEVEQLLQLRNGGTPTDHH
jgi:predicted HTH domain antitoxin